MRRLILVVSVFVAVIMAAPVLAADRCVANIFGQFFRFNGVKLVIGKTTQLAGRFHPGGGAFNLPFDGAVTLDSDGGTTRIGILSYPDASGVGTTAVMWTMVGDKLFNATGSFDDDALGSIDGADTWVPGSCVGFPPAFTDRSPVERAPGIIK